MFDEVACEEVYGYDYADMAEWLDELERDFVNFELQEIAGQQKDAQIEVELDSAYFGA